MTCQNDLFPEVVQPDHPRNATIQQKFEAFHAANPWVYAALVREARNARARGLKRIGVGFLTEIIRWRYFNQTTDRNSGFKISNNYRSRYTRLIAEQEPDLSDFITKRELKAL